MNGNENPVAITPSAIDIDHLSRIRKNIGDFLTDAAARYAQSACMTLDVAPQTNGGVRPFFPSWVTIETLDIDPMAGCSYVADLCRRNDHIPGDRYDIVVCTEVLEHVLQPFDAVAELKRLLRPSGVLLVSTPYNFRIHGPLPDCWRFTEHGLRALLKEFEIMSLVALETPDRPLMPIQYTVEARKPVSNLRV
jgi:SAM-dependent methyltransferase